MVSHLSVFKNQNILNQLAEFKSKQREIAFKDYYWNLRKGYFLISYFICTFLFLIHGLFDFNRTFYLGSPEILMGVRGSFFGLCCFYVFYYLKKDRPGRVFEFCFILQLFSVLIIALLTYFTKGESKTLPIGVMIMCSAFYIMLPGRSLYALISSVLITLVYIFSSKLDGSQYTLFCYIIIASNFILWTYCKNQHRFYRLEFSNKENLEELAEMKSKLLTTLAHDIRSPLSVILMHANLGRLSLKDETSNPLYESFSKIESNIEKTEALIKELLDWTLVKSKRNLAENIESLSFDVTILKSIDYLSEMIDLKHICLDVDVESFSLPHDPTMIETVFRNLLSNSIKFTNENGKILIKSYFDQLNNEYKVVIKDEAPQMSQEQIGAIKNGQEVKPSQETKSQKGFGIGLHLVRAFLKAHNAKFDITTEKNGNIFTLSFPFKS